MIDTNRLKNSDALYSTPDWKEYIRRLTVLREKVGNQQYEQPYDINGVLIKTGDKVRSTIGLDGLNIREGIATLSTNSNLPNCITVDNWTSAASLWEKVV